MPGWPFGAQAVEVAVDRETGVIKLIRVASAHDVGRAINPLAVTGQIEGGIMMGLGYALLESLLFDEGKITNASFADYKIPTARDIPAATPIIVEKNYDSEPYGAKGVGEMSVFGIAPAVANAIVSAPRDHARQRASSTIHRLVVFNPTPQDSIRPAAVPCIVTSSCPGAKRPAVARHET